MLTGDCKKAATSVLDERRLWLSLVEQAARADALRQQIEGMRQSLSWRVTAPLRRLRGIFPRREQIDGPLLSSGEGVNAHRSQSFPLWMNSVRVLAGDQRARWFIDVTELAREDLGAGVERVTRRILGELILAPPENVRIQPVKLDPRGIYVEANAFLCSFLGMFVEEWAIDEPINPSQGDRFIGLDFCRQHALLLGKALGALKERGVPISLMMHDTLPISHPAWFPDGVSEAFEAWLRVAAASAHQLICISQCTALAVSKVMTERGLDASSLDIRVMPLGADFIPVPVVRSPLSPKPDGVKRVLTVGTIEPRKGHAQALAAFEELWRQGASVEWVIAGRVGWKVDDLVERITNHPEAGHRLHWIDRPDDRALISLYSDCDALLAPSFGEGYGLPIAEAGRYGLALLLRDLPVFREIAGDSAVFFSGSEHDALMCTLLTWLSNTNVINDVSHHWSTWSESAEKLKEICAPLQHSLSGSET